MFCQNCRYNLRGLSAGHCPECGREFDPSDSKTFSRSGRRFEGMIAADARPRATIAIAALVLWSITALRDPVSVPSILSGPFIVVHVWDWWPTNALVVAAGLCILTPLGLWVMTDRLRFAGVAMLASLLSVWLSAMVVFRMAAGE